MIQRRYAIPVFLLVTFGVSWGALLTLSRGSIPVPNAEALDSLPVIILAMLLGPSLGGFLARCIVPIEQNWQWEWISTIGVAPVMILLLVIPLELWHPTKFTPAFIQAKDPIGVIASGIFYGLLSATFEESGWTGFLIPLLLYRRVSVETTGWVVGLLWGIWGLGVAYWGSGRREHGQIDWVAFLPWIPRNLLLLPMYRRLMLRVYIKTEGKLLLAILLHASLIAFLPIILMPSCRGLALCFLYISLASLTFAVDGLIVAGWIR